jgi:hypothetical protein
MVEVDGTLHLGPKDGVDSEKTGVRDLTVAIPVVDFSEECQ